MERRFTPFPRPEPYPRYRWVEDGEQDWAGLLVRLVERVERALERVERDWDLSEPAVVSRLNDLAARLERVEKALAEKKGRAKRSGVEGLPWA